MNFADADSVLQLLTGLNLAYFSFRDIRGPASARLNDNLTRCHGLVAILKERCSSLEGRLTDLRSRAKAGRASMILASRAADRITPIPMSLRVRENNLGLYDGDFEHSGGRFDAVIQKTALFFAVTDFGVLIYSAHHAQDNFSAKIFDPLILFSCTPPGLALWWNLMFASAVRSSAEGVRKIREKLNGLASDARSADLALAELSQQIEMEAN